MPRPSVFALLFLAAPLVAQDAPRRPNILFVMPDQMRGMDMGCAGNAEVETPHLDRLAKEGLRFRNTFANTPTCSPARATILTGQYSHRHGVVCNDLRLHESRTTLAELLRAAGYRTGFIGKWHLDGGKRAPGFVPPGPRRQGFDFWAAHECSHDHFSVTYFRDQRKPIEATNFETTEWAEVAREFLSAESEAPFFLMIQPGPPHNPYRAPRRYARGYDSRELTMRPNWRRIEGGSRRDIAAYYAMITAVDELVGRLVSFLEENGQGDDTIVLFTSDHGDMLGSHGHSQKHKPWEESVSVPGILRYPREVAGARVSDAFLTHVDLAPTLLALAGLEIPDTMQGADLSSVVLGRADADQAPSSAYFQILVPSAKFGVEHAWRAVRTARHKYARTKEGPWLLYDLQSDPYELRNLALEEDHAELRDALDRELAQWMERIGDDWSNDYERTDLDDGRLHEGQAFHSLEEYLTWERERSTDPGR